MPGSCSAWPVLPQGSSLVVAAATLVVAAVFQPARRRIQGRNGPALQPRRHDAARTIAAFNTRLRDEVDLEALTGELLAVVEETMQPTQTSLWPRPQPSAGSAAAIMVRQRT